MAFVPNSSLVAGFTALKQEDYLTAIVNLEAVGQIDSQPAEKLRAQMGLILAYTQVGAINRAIALCQALTASDRPPVQQWAKHQAELINQRQTNQVELRRVPEPDLTGFVAQAQPATVSKKVSVAGKKNQLQMEIPTLEQIGIQPPEARVTDASTPSTTAAFTWRQAGRIKRRQPLPQISYIPLWLLQVGTAIALFWLIRTLAESAMATTNDLLVKLPYLEPFQLFYRNPTQFILLTLVTLFVLSPWLIDLLLRLVYRCQPLDLTTLATYSSEASRMLPYYCRRQGWRQPTLWLIPTAAPAILTYGNLPRTARIAVSQALLNQLADEEIATIYATQLAQIKQRDFAVMSLVLLVTQCPYIVYWQLSQWGNLIADRRQQLTEQGAIYYLLTFSLNLTGAISSCAYLLWYLLTTPALWLSQLRIYYGDRLAAEITGNPNGLTRALIKIAQGVTQDIQRQGHTSWLLESLNLWLPVSYRQALTLSSLSNITELEAGLAWDCLHPYRYWLTINNSHPLVGDRLQRLNHIARLWHLETELNLTKPQHKQIVCNSPLLLQGAPWFGICFGFGFGCLAWLVGAVGSWLGNAHLAWMYGDWVIISGCLPVGFSIGTLIRINSFFPDLNFAPMQTSSSWQHLLANPQASPADSQLVRLHGKLLGRRGISNWLGQDLILQFTDGLIKLHHISALGPVGSPLDLVTRQISITGWFRRGANPEIDVDTWQAQAGKTTRSAHPIWSTLLAAIATVSGVYIILRSGV